MDSPPDSDSLYLASLDKCLKDGHRLMSWKQAFQALAEPDADEHAPNLKLFLHDEASIAHLRFPQNPFQPRSLDANKDLETRTAAIHVTPPKTASYDIEEIKADALWLSSEVKLDEVVALRIVMLEWQERAAAHLMTGYTEGELISIQHAVGSPDLALSAFSQHYGIPGPMSDDFKHFETEEKRRERLLKTYMSEKEHILGIYLLLAVENTLNLAGREQEDNRPIGLLPSKSWITEIWAKIEESALRSAKRSVSISGKQLISQSLIEAEQRLRALESGSGFALVAQANSEELEANFLSSQLVEFVRILQIILVHLSAAMEPPESHSMAEWFQFADKYGFFENFLPPLISQVVLVAPIQILMSLISVQVLKLPYALDQLHERQVNELETLPYLDRTCFEAISDTLYNAASHNSTVSSPVMLAWSIFLQNLRETTLSRPADDLHDDNDDSSPVQSRQGSIQPSNFIVDLVDSLMRRVYDEDAIHYLAKAAVDETKAFAVIAEICRSFGSFLNPTDSRLLEYNARMTLLELVRQAVLMISYGPEVLEATLAIISCGSQYEELYKPSTLYLERRILTNFLNDDRILVPIVLDQVRVRYPFESAPFLAVAKVFCAVKNLDIDESICPSALFENASKFTALLPKDFTGYESVREDENANLVRLADDLPLFIDLNRRRVIGGRDSTSRLISFGSSPDEEEELYIPRGTDGSVLNESKPFVVMWFHDHSVLKYFARLLSRFATAFNDNVIQGAETIERGIQCDIISLFATQLCALTRPASHRNHLDAADSEKALWILEEASDGLGRNQDLVTVVYDVFEGELSRQAHQTSVNSTNLLSSCIHFLRGVTQTIPNRAWPLLVKSDLLEIDGKGGRISGIISATEVFSDKFEFVTKCLALFEALVSDVLSNAVSRQCSDSSTAVKRFDRQTQSSIATPQKIIHKVILAFTKAFTDVLQTSATWHFALPDQQAYLVSSILSAFQRIIYSVHGFDDSRDNSKKLTAALAPAAEHIVNTFICPDHYDSTISYLLSLCLRATQPISSPFARVSHQYASEQSRKILRFIATVLDISMLTNSPAVQLQQKLFFGLPFIIRLYVRQELHRNLIVRLLSSLVKSAGMSEKEPSSLLGNLTQDSAKQFLSVLGQRNRPLGNTDLGVVIWGLMADVVNNRQPWFTTLLLTGDPPKRATKDFSADDKEGHQCRAETIAPKSTNETMLAIALHTLSAAPSMSGLRELAMLKFVVTAQAKWPWLSRKLRKEPEAVAQMLSYVESLEFRLIQSERERADQFQAAALIAEILAMFIHNSRQVGELPDIKDVVNRTAFYRESGLAVADYNSSLHGNLKRNFEKCFSGVTPSSYKRLLGDSDYGKDFFYDMELADATLGFSPAWRSGTGKTKGFADEFERANLNLSVVEAQIKLASSWKSLAIELSRSVVTEKAVQRPMIDIVLQCLSANIESNLHETVFESLTQVRVDLVLILLQRLVANKIKLGAMLSILSTSWDAIKASGQNFELAFTGSNATYYRSLVQVLLLAIQPHTYIAAPADNLASSTSSSMDKPSPKRLRINKNMHGILLDVVSDVVARGFRALATQLHEDPSSVLPGDFALLTCIFQSLLRVQDVEGFVAQMTLRLCDLQVTRYAAALFSWSAQLTGAENDPVYGELSISFLRELSTIPSMAEHLATESILAQLSTAHLLELMRGRSRGVKSAKGYGPFDSPARMHVIWSRGILPLVLNLLVAVGEFFAEEAASFLNSFPDQLERATSILSSSSVAANAAGAATRGISLNSACEIHTLSILAVALAQYRASPASAATPGGVIPDLRWDPIPVKDDLEVWLTGKRSTLRERIVPCSERELALFRCKPSASARNDAAAVDAESESRLEQMILAELAGAFTCLNALTGGGMNVNLPIEGGSSGVANSSFPGSVPPFPATSSSSAAFGVSSPTNTAAASSIIQQPATTMTGLGGSHASHLTSSIGEPTMSGALLT